MIAYLLLGFDIGVAGTLAGAVAAILMRRRHAARRPK